MLVLKVDPACLDPARTRRRTSPVGVHHREEDGDILRGDAHGLLSQALLGCSGDLVTRLSNGPYGASSDLLGELIVDTKWISKSTDHASKGPEYTNTGS